MNTAKLGNLEQLPLRSYWTSESRDFTPWLAEPSNLRLLSKTLDIDLELERQEAGVGAFAADLLCKNSADGSWVVIENQIEKTDHTHLGQIFTYAAGLNAKTLIWVASKFTEEHRAALDWLNENTAEGVSIFGVEMELWRIDGSPPAPKFNVISKPNDWSRVVRTRAESATDMSDHKRLQLEFWTEFRAWMEEHSKLRPQKASPQHWLNVSIGRSGFHLAAIISTWSSFADGPELEIRVELLLTSDQSNEHFATLSGQKESLEKNIGESLIWHAVEGNKQHRIFVRRGSDFTKRENWPSQFEWLKMHLEKFNSVFGPIIRSLR